jgi:CSLREA domain-containing protein
VRHRLTPLLAAAAVALAAPLAAADFVVTKYNDSASANGCLPGNCSLREAVIAANADPAADRILLSAGIYTISAFGIDDDAGGGDLDILTEIEIVGAGARITHIDGKTMGVNNLDPIFTVQDLGKLTIRDATVREGTEGGITVFGELLLERCEIHNNSFQGNADGVRGINAAVTIRDSAVINNGDGVSVVGGDLLLENVSFYSNNGFQIFVSTATSARCTHCTIEGPVSGNGEIRVSEAVFELASSIVVGNCDLLSGATIDTLGGNLESPGHTCSLRPAVAGDLEDVADAGLAAAPADNGGPTRTFQLDADSPAVNLVPSSGCLSADQRGVSRGKLSFLDCDSGAFERSAAPPPTPLFLDGFEQGDEEAWSDVVG